MHIMPSGSKRQSIEDKAFALLSRTEKVDDGSRPDTLLVVEVVVVVDVDDVWSSSFHRPFSSH